jgi:hypothetical protein
MKRVARRLRAAARARAAAKRPPDLRNTYDMFVWCRQRGIVARAGYLWPTLEAVRTAHSLGVPAVSVIELGVAGGNGLLALEEAAVAAEGLLGVNVEVFGFDTGRGLPPPEDHRDIPYVTRPGIFAMDEAALRARLQRAKLVLGPVAETVPRWLAEPHPPIAFCAFDLDYYSSTRDALRLLEADTSRLLPRVACYFDDVLAYGWSEFVGVRAAIAEFNASHERRKVGSVYGQRWYLPQSELHDPWPDRLFVAHVFDHDQYAVEENQVSLFEDALGLEP